MPRKSKEAAMRLALLCAACLLPGSPALPLSPGQGGEGDSRWQLAQDYLKRFYSSDSKMKNANSLEVRLKRMEGFFHLPITGILSPRIIEIMQKPRCGVPDVAEYSLFPNHPKWTSKVVTYRIMTYTSDLPHITVNQLVAKAFKIWSEVIPLTFKRVRWGTADIMIGFARRAHGDSYPFDGPGATLAHAFAPGPGLGGDAHFDEDEHWTDGSGIGINFLYVATHELGHSLGLTHSSDPNAVMYPTYSKEDSKNFKLSQDDINGIQILYGTWDVTENLINSRLIQRFLNYNPLYGTPIEPSQNSISKFRKYQEREMIQEKNRNFSKNTHSFIGFYVTVPNQN